MRPFCFFVCEHPRPRLHPICSLRSRRPYFFFVSRNAGDSGQGEEHDLFAGHGADVVVQAQHLDAGDLLDHRFQDRPRRFDQLGPDFFEQVPPLLGRQRLDQLLFGRGQDALEADHEKVADQVGVNVLGPPAHVFLFKARHPFADGGFDFSLCFHGDLERVPTPVGTRTVPGLHGTTGACGSRSIAGMYDTERGRYMPLAFPVAEPYNEKWRSLGEL